jgi:hypothetical protein
MNVSMHWREQMYPLAECHSSGGVMDGAVRSTTESTDSIDRSAAWAWRWPV